MTNNSYLICLCKGVKPLGSMEIDVKKTVQLTAKTMYVIYRVDRVLDVNQDGKAQIVAQVGLKLQFV